MMTKSTIHMTVLFHTLSMGRQEASDDINTIYTIVQFTLPPGGAEKSDNIPDTSLYTGYMLIGGQGG